MHCCICAETNVVFLSFVFFYSFSSPHISHFPTSSFIIIFPSSSYSFCHYPSLYLSFSLSFLPPSSVYAIFSSSPISLSFFYFFPCSFFFLLFYIALSPLPSSPSSSYCMSFSLSIFFLSSSSFLPCLNLSLYLFFPSFLLALSLFGLNPKSNQTKPQTPVNRNGRFHWLWFGVRFQK